MQKFSFVWLKDISSSKKMADHTTYCYAIEIYLREQDIFCRTCKLQLVFYLRWSREQTETVGDIHNTVGIADDLIEFWTTFSCTLLNIVMYIVMLFLGASKDNEIIGDTNCVGDVTECFILHHSLELIQSAFYRRQGSSIRLVQIWPMESGQVSW